MQRTYVECKNFSYSKLYYFKDFTCKDISTDYNKLFCIILYPGFSFI